MYVNLALGRPPYHLNRAPHVYRENSRHRQPEASPLNNWNSGNVVRQSMIDVVDSRTVLRISFGLDLGCDRVLHFVIIAIIKWVEGVLDRSIGSRGMWLCLFILTSRLTSPPSHWYQYFPFSVLLSNSTE